MTRLFRLSEQSFGRLVLVLVALGFSALVAAGVTAAWVQMQSQEQGEVVNHTRGVETDLALLSSAAERAETARRGYLIDPQPLFRERYERSAAEIDPILARLVDKTSDNDEQQQRLAQLATVYGQQKRAQAQSVALIDVGSSDAAVVAFQAGNGSPALQRGRAIIADMIATEQNLLAVREARVRQSVRLFYSVLIVAGLLLLGVAAASILVIMRYTRDLAQSRDALQGLNANLETVVDERTKDLQRANDEIQRFAYIVSHDLRSPLVNVMGFTSELDSARRELESFVDSLDADSPDLVTEPVRLAVKEDLPEAIGFIRTSTQKMDRLINSILKLSREGRRTLATETIDTEELIQQIADTLHHRIEDAGAELVIQKPLPPLTGDRLAIDQIFSNLIENAVKYLKPGRPGRIVVSGRREGRQAVFDIADNGRGIDPRDHQRIFDLFRRSGPQDQPGEGIGLAHVRALAYRLGGLIDCQSELDKGATFTLMLPHVYQPVQGQAA